MGSSIGGFFGNIGSDVGDLASGFDPSSIDYSSMLGGGVPDFSGALSGAGDAFSGAVGGALAGAGGGGGYNIPDFSGVDPNSVDYSSVLNGNISYPGLTTGAAPGISGPVTTPMNPVSNIVKGLTPPATNIPGLVPTTSALPSVGSNGNLIGSNGQPLTGADGNPVGAGGGSTGGGFDMSSLTSLLSTLGLGGALLGNSGQGLGPEADKLRAMADSNQQLVNGQLMPTAIANEQGSINGQALNTVQRTLNAKQAAIRKSYADMGMSGSTMEAQDLGAASDAAQQQIFQTGQEMATTGLATAAQLSGVDQSIYTELMNAQIQQDQALQDALAAFAGAVAK